MIEEFFASWELFQNTYLTGWLIAVVLSLVGVLVVARDQIFLGAAVSQASTLGIAVALALGPRAAAAGLPRLDSAAFPAVMAVVFSVLAALVTAPGGARGKESHEAITGWVFLASASLAILIVSHSPHGLEEIHALLFSSIIGATRVDVWVFGGLALLIISGVAIFHRPLLLFTMDAAMAAAVGMRVKLWTAVTYASFGLAVGLSIRVSGLLYTFGCLVLPPLVAKNLVREVLPMFIAAPAIALAASSCGFLLAHRADFPPAQVTVALLSFLLALAWCVRALRSSRRTA